MEKKKSSRAPITCFTADAEFFAVASKRTVGIWNTSNGNLVAQWNQQDGDPDIDYTCMALRFTEKKKIRRRNDHSCLLAIGTNDGLVLVVDVLTGENIWKSSISQSGRLTALSFSNEETSLYAVGSHEVVEIDTESGQLVKGLKTTKKPICSASFCRDRKILCIFDGYVRLLRLDDGKELLKMKSNLSHVQLVAISDDAEAVITSGPGETTLEVWNCDWHSKTLSRSTTIPIVRPASAIECKTDNSSGDGLVILAVLESGLTYLWRFETLLQDKIELIHVKVEPISSGIETPRHKRKSISAARLKSIEADKRVMVLTAKGSANSPQFNVSICEPGENVARMSGSINEEEVLAQKDVAPAESFIDRETKKRAAAELDDVIRDVGDTGVETIENIPIEDDPTEPTMGEKLERLSLLQDGKSTSNVQQEALPLEQPRADSVVVLLKQALRADDRVLLLDCLYNRNEKVIANSIALLNPSDVVKFLQYLASITDSRGALLVCALPWLRRLLLQHASGIMSQESSLMVLNSLYQLIEARVSTFRSAVKLSSTLDLLFSGVIDEGEDDDVEPIQPVIYEDKDTDEEGEEEEDGMESDGEENREDGSDGELDEIDTGDFEDMSE